MNSKELRLKRRYIYEQNKKFTNTLVSLPEPEFSTNAPQIKVRPIVVWRSCQFLVQVFHEPYSINYGNIKRLSICRMELDNDGNWKDGISWEQMQLIKNQCGFSDKEAVEIYPAQEDVVNVANMRHLWILPNKLPFSWRAK